MSSNPQHRRAGAAHLQARRTSERETERERERERENEKNEKKRKRGESEREETITARGTRRSTKDNDHLKKLAETLERVGVGAQARVAATMERQPYRERMPVHYLQSTVW